MFPKINLLGTITDTYTLCALLSPIALLVVSLVLRPKEFHAKYVFIGMIILSLAAVFGAILFNVIAYASEHRGQHIGEVFRTSGTAYLGVPIFSFFILWFCCKTTTKWFSAIPSFLVAADFSAPLFMLDRVIGRLGCLGYGCCYGIPSNLPWAYAFRSWGIYNIVPRHPTQAYAMICALAIFASSRYLYKRTKAIPGVFAMSHKDAPSAGITFFYVWLCYGVLRFFNEFLRAEGPFVVGPFKISHIILFLFAIVSVIGLLNIIKRSAAKDEILKVLKGTFVRLVLWLIGAGFIVLSLISA